MTYLPLLLGTVSSLSAREAAIGWLLPAGRWLFPVGMVGVPLEIYWSSVATQTLIVTTPANGHHRVAASVDAYSRARGDLS
jgi:hypothetical protein